MPIISLSNEYPVPVLSNTTEVEVAQEQINSTISNLTPEDIIDTTGATDKMVVQFDGTNLVVVAANVSDFNNDANYISTGDNVSELTNDSNYITNTDDTVLQSYATGSEPATPANGTLIYDTDLNQAKYYNGTTWVAL